MTDIVDETLRQWRRGGHVWGESDCMLSIGDYVAATGGFDLTTRFRGTYDTEEAAMAHMDANGGAEGLIDQMRLERTDSPVRGDVAVVQGIGALCTGSGFALRLDRGVIEVDRRFVTYSAAWKVPR